MPKNAIPGSLPGGTPPRSKGAAGLPAASRSGKQPRTAKKSQRKKKKR